MAISRQRLSVDVHKEIIAQIIRGEYASGQRLKDTEIAESLGVSRTPVREALLRLEREGFISSQKHLGFTVKSLRESEIREVYPLVRLLECAALQSSPPPLPDRLVRLRGLLGEMAALDSDPVARIEADSAWHRALLEEAGNQHLLRILADLKRIVFRYEYAFMQITELVETSIAEHASVLDALERGDRRKAVKLLGDHWDRCADATAADFSSRLAMAGTAETAPAFGDD